MKVDRRTGGMRRAPGTGGMAKREIIFLSVMAGCLALAVIPYIRKGQAEAASVRTLNNLVQWGIGLNLYLIDHENRLPRVGPAQPSAKAEDAWYQALPPYLSQKNYGELQESGFGSEDLAAQIWHDPALDHLMGGARGTFIFPYAMNRWLQPVPDLGAYAVYDLASPRSTVFLTESASTDPGVLPSAVSYRRSRRTISPTAESYVLFVDGHVDPVTREVLSAEPDPEAQTLPSGLTWLPFPGATAPVME